MRKTLCAILLMLCCHAATAQPHFEKSTAIEEPAKVGYDKVLLMRNGKTCYLHYSGEGGIALNIYDAAHKLLSKTKVNSTRWDSRSTKNTTVLGTYDINNELVVFLQQPEKKHPVLYRIRINTDDGKLLKEEVVATTKRGNRFFNKDNVNTQIFVVKDPKSDCYAVVYFDNLDERADDALKVLHFDGRHSLISAGRIESPDNKIKNIVYLDGVVNGDKSVFVSTYYTGSGDESSKIFVSRLNTGETSLTTKPLDFTADFMKSNMAMAYNAETKKIQMAIVTFAKSQKNTNLYMSVLAYVNPETLDVLNIKELSNQKIATYARNYMAAEDDFAGLTQAMILNDKNQTILLKQAITQVSTTTKGGSSYVSSTTLGNIGISELAEDGTETQSYAMNHSSGGGEVPMMYMQNIRAGAWQNLYGNRHYNKSEQAYTFRYISGKRGSFVVFNDYAKRIENPDNARFRKSDWKSYRKNALYIETRNGNTYETFLFGKPATKKSQNTCFTSAADQNDNGQFATVMCSKKGREKNYYIVWVSFE